MSRHGEALPLFKWAQSGDILPVRCLDLTIQNFRMQGCVSWLTHDLWDFCQVGKDGHMVASDFILCSGPWLEEPSCHVRWLLLSIIQWLQTCSDKLGKYNACKGQAPPWSDVYLCKEDPVVDSASLWHLLDLKSSVQQGKTWDLPICFSPIPSKTCSHGDSHICNLIFCFKVQAIEPQFYAELLKGLG